MAFERLIILPERGAPITAMFNPEKYTVSKSLQLAEIGIPGLDSPVVQYVRGQNEKISMELFFDTTDAGMTGNVTDVRSLTGPVYQLLKVNGELHAPPRVRLQWGTAGHLTSQASSTSPWLLLESASQELNLFSPEGVPLRAKLTVTFREAWTIEAQLQDTPRHSSDHTKLHRVQRGETLSQVAYVEYQDPALWRPIAAANNLANPRQLQPGMQLVVPPITGVAGTGAG